MADDALGDPVETQETLVHAWRVHTFPVESREELVVGQLPAVVYAGSHELLRVELLLAEVVLFHADHREGRQLDDVHL